MKNRMFFALLLVLCLAAFAACGDDGGDEDSGDPDVAATEEASDDCNTEEVETEEGLVYQDTVCGTGEGATAGDSLVVHYAGKLEDGTQFDSSYDRGEPFPFVLGESSVIEGWHIGFEGMKAGGKRTLTIPPELAYGEGGYPPTIPPDATLIFEVELVEITAAP